MSLEPRIELSLANKNMGAGLPCSESAKAAGRATLLRERGVDIFRMKGFSTDACIIRANSLALARTVSTSGSRVMC